MNLILFGFKGVGKTYLGKRLATVLNRDFLDTDDLICDIYFEKGHTVRQIYQKLGERAFRELEAEAISLLRADFGGVIAVGGGSVLLLDNIKHLEKIGRLIYLRASFETVKKRILKEGIPSFVSPSDPIESLHQIYCQRLPFYESIRAECIDVDQLQDESLLMEICSKKGVFHGC